jgi:D-alanyl-D-alanine carboxypeptidase
MTTTSDCSQYWPPQKIVDWAIQQGAAQPPGTFYYSDTNYMLLGIIAQRVTHKPLAWLMRHLIFNRLHLRQTSAPTRSLTIPSPATAGFSPVIADKTFTGYQPAANPSPSIYFGAGNVISTLHDLRIWARALGTGALLKRRTQRERLRLLPIVGDVFSPLAGTGINTGLQVSYGLGIAGLGGMLGHNGEVLGYTADMWYIPRRHATVVVLFNSVAPCEGGLVMDAAAVSLAEAAFGGALKTVPTTPLTCPVPTGLSALGVKGRIAVTP